LGPETLSVIDDFNHPWEGMELSKVLKVSHELDRPEFASMDIVGNKCVGYALSNLLPSKERAIIFEALEEKKC